MQQESSFEIFDSAIKQALRNYWNYQDWEDLYQECYMKILDVLANNTYEPVFNLYGYAYKIARNTISTYMYHAKKLTTLANEEFPEVPTNADFDGGIILENALTQTLDKFSNVLPKDFTRVNLLNLLVDDVDPNDLLMTVVKGDLIWNIAKPNK